MQKTKYVIISSSVPSLVHRTDSRAAPISSRSPPVCTELQVPSVMSQPKMQTFPFSHVRFGRRSVVKQVQVLLVVAIGFHHQQRNNFCDEQQQNIEWSGLSSDMCCITALPFGGPGRDVHYTLSGVKGQCPPCG
jgi:hypothetical protein